jgi:autotransporter-associated beta strand protein
MKNLMTKTVQVLLLIFGLSIPAQAATRIWDGGALYNNDWATPLLWWTFYNNWDNDTALSNGDSLVFAGKTRLTPNNNLIGFSANSITFSNNAESFTLTGNAITLTGDIINNNTGVQTVRMGIALAAGSHTVHAAAGDIVLSGALSGAGSVTKTGTSTLTLTAESTYTNTTTVSEGALIVNGSLQSCTITLASGTLLGGTGTVQSATLNAGATLAAGDTGAGTMTFNGNLLLSAGSTHVVQVFSSSLHDIARGNATNTVTVNGTMVFDFSGNTTVVAGSSFQVLQNWESIDLTNASFSATGLASGLSLNTDRLAAEGIIQIVSETPESRPAPENLTATADKDSIDLAWDPLFAPDLAGYTVYRSTVSGTNYTSIVSGLSTNVYTDSSATNSTAYYYVVTASYDSSVTNTVAPVTASNAGSSESAPSIEASATPITPVEYIVGKKNIVGGTNLAMTVSHSVSSHSYQVQWTDSLLNPDWQAAGKKVNGQPGTNLVLNVPIDGVASNRYYRLHIQ